MKSDPKYRRRETSMEWHSEENEKNRVEPNREEKLPGRQPPGAEERLPGAEENLPRS